MISCLTCDSNQLDYPCNEKVSAEIVAEAIASLVEKTHYEGKSLEDLIKEVLAEDQILDQVQRRWLSKIVTQAWKSLTD